MDTATAWTQNGKASHAKLFPAHRTELVEGSGLTEATIEGAGIYSEADAAMLNRKSYSSKMGCALVFPYRDETGAVVLSRIKPTHPPKYNGRSAKYLSPSGGGVRAYFPRPVFSILDDTTSRLLITEGEKKALAATQAGFHCVGLSGVDCWHAKKSSSLLPDLDRIKWNGRLVFICFDSDASENESVAANERLLASSLAMQGAKVRIVRLQPGDDGAKVGLDDFLVANGPASLESLIGSAEEPQPPEVGEARVPCSKADPAGEADDILLACQHKDDVRLVYWQGGFWWWSGGCYAERPIDEVKCEVTTALNRKFFDVRARHVTDIVEQLKAKTLLSSRKESPTWIVSKPDRFDPIDCFATKNEIIHLPSFVGGAKDATIPATPNYFHTSATDYPLDRNAAKPTKWHNFLSSIWGDDKRSIGALQELFGYCLTPDTSQQKIFMLVGPPRSGKGTIARVLTDLIGQKNIAAPTLSGLATNFGLQPLLGKSVAVISDARLSGRTDQS